MNENSYKFSIDQLPFGGIILYSCLREKTKLSGNIHVYIPFSKRPSSIPNHSLIHCVTLSKWLKLSGLQCPLSDTDIHLCAIYRRQWCSGCLINSKFCCRSIAQSCRTLCDPMDCSTPGFPIPQYLRVCSNSFPLSQCCHPNISSSVIPFPSSPQSFLA